MADTARALLPAMVQSGITAIDEVAIETLEERLRMKSVGGNAVLHVNSLVGAWTPTSRLNPQSVPATVAARTPPLPDVLSDSSRFVPLALR